MNILKKAYFKTKNIISPPVMRELSRVRTVSNIYCDSLSRPLNSKTLILNGFWRSGTTIALDAFSECLSSKSYFEPFEPGLPNQARFIFEYARANDYDPQNRPFVAVLMPQIGNNKESNRGLWEYLDSIVNGNFSNPGLVRNRKSSFEGLRNGRVIKFVRAHFLIESLYQRYRIPIIHVRRHPYSVIASLVKVRGWNQCGFDQLDLTQQFFQNDAIPSSRDLVRLRELIDLNPEMSNIEKIAAYWCYSELATDSQIQRLEGGGLIIQFERLVSMKGDAVCDALDKLNLKPVNRNLDRVFARKSKTTHYGVKDARGYDPSLAYKSILCKEEMNRIDNTLKHFEIDVKDIEQDVAHNLYCRPLSANSRGM